MSKRFLVVELDDDSPSSSSDDSELQSIAAQLWDPTWQGILATPFLYILGWPVSLITSLLSSSATTNPLTLSQAFFFVLIAWFVNLYAISEIQKVYIKKGTKIGESINVGDSEAMKIFGWQMLIAPALVLVVILANIVKSFTSI